MDKADRQKPMWLEAPFLVGITLTVVILGFAVWSLSVGEVCNNVGWCVSKWDVLKDAPPNEIGDSLAGFAGTLAFVWLIVTVWLQATELREQRNEFEKMAEAQEAQVGLLVKQGKIFEDEQLQRDQERAERTLEELLTGLSLSFPSSLKDLQSVERSGPNPMERAWFYVDSEGMSNDVFLRAASFETNSFFWQIKSRFIDEKIAWKKIDGKSSLENCVVNINKIASLHDRLSEDAQIRLENMRLAALRENIERLLKLEIWLPKKESNYREPRL